MNRNPFIFLWMYLILMNLISFSLCGVDKHRAKTGAWRVPENTLLVCGLLGGCYGLFIGMQAFRHKTKKLKFTILVPLQCVVWAGVMVYILFLDR